LVIVIVVLINTGSISCIGNIYVHNHHTVPVHWSVFNHSTDIPIVYSIWEKKVDCSKVELTVKTINKKRLFYLPLHQSHHNK